ncbi:hypothetical protein GCM10009122_08880 [Fulvivirga kasyanovii]|uniref:Secreted protein n=1 Tax=Fulvivirga kasyanovii TaxID=396812 RepID=A0ABW9S061_9BACT|nr:hypothetical protein [Fulvivirga kasyanovii]MTI29104.1 hypothetical protein [Fulvivirga kasyanovii]
MNTKRIIAAILIVTCGSLTMSCSEEEIKPSLKNSIEAATEGNKGHVEPPIEFATEGDGGHVEPPIENGN